jgi:ferredoxin
MNPLVLEKDKLGQFLSSVGEELELVGPVARSGGQYSFQVIQELDELVLDYIHTILPPKKFFLPQREVLLAYKLGQPASAEAVNQATPRALIGVHPCDLLGIRHLDTCFTSESEDWNYSAKRACAVVIGTDCLPDEFCFCDGVGTLRPRAGFDLFLLDLEDRYLVTVGTERGQQLLGKHAPGLPEATAADLEAQEAHYRKKREMQKARLHADVHDLPMIFQGATSDPVWDRYGERCLGCGTCTNVCPTCYCFDVEDEVEVSLTDGTRRRIWDSCQLRAFTEVAGGEVFREKLSLRVRHRVFRKLHYLHNKFNEPNCSGCGRCGRQCVADIRMHEVVNDLVASAIGMAAPGKNR